MSVVTARLLGALFFLSGISGLIYQSLWLRMLSLVFGVTVYAASTVLAMASPPPDAVLGVPLTVTALVFGVGALLLVRPRR